MKKAEEFELRFRPRPIETVSLDVPKDALDSPKKVAAIRDMSYQALFSHYVAHLNFNYFLRAQVGARPFIGLGAGIARAIRDHIDEPQGIVFLNIPERTRGEEINTPILTTGFGLDYIPGAGSRILLRFFMGANYNFEESQLLSRINCISNIKIGVGF